MTQIDKTGVSGQGTPLENAKALEESPLVASLRAHISKWYGVGENLNNTQILQVSNNIMLDRISNKEEAA